MHPRTDYRLVVVKTEPLDWVLNSILKRVFKIQVNEIILNIFVKFNHLNNDLFKKKPSESQSYSPCKTVTHIQHCFECWCVTIYLRTQSSSKTVVSKSGCMNPWMFRHWPCKECQTIIMLFQIDEWEYIVLTKIAENIVTEISKFYLAISMISLVEVPTICFIVSGIPQICNSKPCKAMKTQKNYS